MKPSVRNFFRKWHRDIAYFFVGLILSFSISGIALNHRRTFNSRQYSYISEDFKMAIRTDPNTIDEPYVESLLPQIGIEKNFRFFRIQNGKLRIFYEDALAEINYETGEGLKEWYRRRPLLAEMADLHQKTDEWWIWYSDIFGVGMIFIAISGMFISNGKASFKKRGWWLATIGLVFPLIFLIFLA